MNRGSSTAATANFFGFDLAYDKTNNRSTNTALQGLAGSNSILMGQLIYSHQPGSNKLAKITDQAGDTRSYQLGGGTEAPIAGMTMPMM